MTPAYAESLALLRRAATPHGFLASVQPTANYQRIWTRDGVICGLAALLSEEADLRATFEATLRTVFEAQHPVGFFPSNVDPRTGLASYGGNCGRVDNVSWAVVGLLQYAQAAEQPALAERYKPHVERGLALLEAWEFNGKHLVYVPQSGDWADEYVQHGYVLYDQLLRLWALELAHAHWPHAAWHAKAQAMRHVLRRNYWNAEPQPTAPEPLYAPNLVHQLRQAPRTFWLMGFNPARVYAQFDVAANALALLLGLGTDAQTALLLEHLRAELAARPGLLPCFSPAIAPPDPLMPELTDNYAYTFRNFPHEFHNGGAWPVWNGWLAAALAAAEPELSAQLLTRLDAANRRHALPGQAWGFYENLHGLTQAPIGVAHCTWSAAGYVVAHAYQRGQRLWMAPPG